MNATQELDNLRHGKFHIDCPRMLLKPPCGEGRQLMGGGFIELRDGGALQGQLISPDPYPMEELARSLNCQAGVLIGSEEQYELECQDLSGRTWRSEGLLLAVNSSNHGFTVGFHPRQIRAEDPSVTTRARRTALLFFNTGARFPTNSQTTIEKQRANRPEMKGWSANVAHIEWDGLIMLVVREETGLAVELLGDTLDDSAVHRVLHALEFVLTMPLAPLYAVLRFDDIEETRVFDRVRCETHGAFGPHVGALSRGCFDDFWSAFILYERFLHEHHADQRPPLHGFVSAVNHARGSRDFETMCLTLGVKIESLVRTWLPDLVNHGVPNEEKTKLRKAIQSAGVSAPVRDRALGIVNNVLDAFPVRRAMKKLASDGVIERDGIGAWDALRRPTAHGDSVDLSQATLEACGKVWSAFQRTVLHLIGYAGRITDYGTPGYPTVDFGHRGHEVTSEGHAELQ